MNPRSHEADARRISRRVHLAANVTLESTSHLYAGLSRDVWRGGIFGIAFTKLASEDIAVLAAVCEEPEPYFYEFDED